MPARVLSLALVPVLSLLVRAAPAQAPAPAGVRGPVAWAYRPPVPGPFVILRRFEPPPTPYAAGHRGVDLAVPSGSAVFAAGPGRVTFVGSVAGRGVVVIAHPDGIRTEYEPVAAVVVAGQQVATGTQIGRLVGRHAGCSEICLHWGARRGSAYIDPLSLLRPLGPVRLLPWPDP